ncbi:hypothetical protein L228DRAFT_270990 [Xylona heveae TC161]|uniref:Cyclin-like protein n=1 Tax=Xylona heveae (strain CBS 132557 / TC161) TaxID=1328760 RepID=A0A164ZXM6_XYLHT|nr:hypothetical protein L228DRAFT_270990 [Xylona heveae TC161]KZF19667.1 hypothetical protein L228DRAFT_270990 [Xylona heveae TC161]
MPSFYPRTLPPQMPLTPPDFVPSYNAGSCAGMHVNQGPFSGLPGMSSLHEKARFEFSERYGPSPAFLPPGQMAYHPPPSYNGVAAATSASSAAPLMSGYGSVAAPALPPIRAPDALAAELSSYQARSQLEQDARSKPPPKEDKAVGGVAAHLDYEMEQMSDFVSEMAQGMYDLYASRICLADIDIMHSVQPSSPVPPAFRKWVSQILASTRLPSSTILLGLYYLSSRMTMLPAQGQCKSSSGQVYRMLTVALVLASKFLDDNTFQNRSWSEVSGIAVSELNTLEAEWLVDIDWKLHVESHHIESWRAHWESWTAEAVARASKSVKLAPLDTNIQRSNLLQKPFSPAPMYPAHFGGPALLGSGVERQQSQFHSPGHFDHWFYPAPIEHSPTSAPETGPTTPEYYGLPGPWSFGVAPPPYSLHAVPRSVQAGQLPSQPPSYHHTPYVQPFAQNIWGGHGFGCGCLYCARQHEPFFMPSSFAAQTAAA